MEKTYVEARHDSFYLVGSRVPLAHLIFFFHRSESAEAIRRISRPSVLSRSMARSRST